MATPLPVIVGVDVGGTNTDAVVLSKAQGQGHQVLAEVKHLTTSDVTTGVRNAVLTVLRQAKAEQGEIIVTQVNIGTTHFVNAVVQNKNLSKVSVIRLCGPASIAVPPFSDFPSTLKDVIFGSVHFVDGGYRVDGQVIENVDREEIRKVVEEIKGLGVKGIVICGLFAPTRTEQEEEVKQMIGEFYPEASVTLSHTIGHIGLLERENAAILNECLKELCQRTVAGFRHALKEIGTNCPIFLTQNDGTVISEQQTLATPVFTFASGPTNSMRGATFLCQLMDAIVVDIGGTSTDVGVLKNRFPREASSDVRIAGVRTNFRMPDVQSVGLGGGSYVCKTADGKTTVGPLSAGYNLPKEALVFGTPESNADPNSGRAMTATDIAVAAGHLDLGDKTLVSHIPQSDVTAALERIQLIVADAIDSVRISDEPLPVILVGGGSILLDPKVKIHGVSEILLPKHYGVANAIGAALSQVSGTLDSVVPLETLLDDDDIRQSMERAKRDLPAGATQEEEEKAVMAARKPLLVVARDQAIREACDKARHQAVQAGADPASLQIVEQEEVALSYLPGSVTRIKVKAVGDLANSKDYSTNLTPWVEPPGLTMTQADITANVTKQTRTITGRSLDPSECDISTGVTWAGLTPSQPYVDPQSGEWILSAWDVECIAVGAGILGAGGGGNPNVGRVRARAAVDRGQKIRILSPERILAQSDPEKDLLISLAFMGAPVVLYEQTTSGMETPWALRCLQELYTIGGYENGELKNKEGVEIKEKDGVVYIDDYQPVKPSDVSQTGGSENLKPDVGGRRVVGVLCAEVGGMNSLEPLMVSAILGLPVMDGDGMGRAFPELQMFLPFVYGTDPYPTALVSDKGRRAVILKSETAKKVEDHFRYVAMVMGSAAGLAVAPVKTGAIKNATVLRSFSRVWTIGDCILRARQNNQNPLQALQTVENVKILLYGKICDVTRETSGGFNRGRVYLEGVAPGEEGVEVRLVLDFQNENLVARHVDEKGTCLENLASVPDVISIVDAETAEPIPTEEVRYGQRIAVIVLPVPPILTSERALKVVGPATFGYTDVEYVSVGDYRDPEPFAPQ